ncbi:MAG: DUF4153 domain-containing protein [Bacteroidetes bacterium]|nr:DUF4153 domain-containing protein [Bacteroidota bacterium]
MKLPTIPYLAEAFVAVLRRFPLVMVAAATGVAASMILLEDNLGGDEEPLVEIIMTASLALTIFLSAAIVSEKWRLKPPMSLVPNLVAVGLVALYYLTLDLTNDSTDFVTPIRFAGLNLATHLMVAFLPYLDRTSVEDFWEYNKRLFGNFMVGVFYSLVLFAGLGFAILAVDQLFNLEIDGKIYGHLFVIIAGIFNTAYFLANFPKEYGFQVEETEDGPAPAINPYTTAFKNLTKFILIPIVAIYFLILYAFSAKILVTWTLPEGWISKLVLGFSVAGIFTYLLNYLLVKFDDSLAVKGYRRWFFYVLLPMVVLLFIAIGRRIGDYGVTEGRYVVATAGVWLLLMSLYFIFSKRDNIKFIPISLAAFALLTVLGPFSAFKVSERNQVGQLKALLEKNSMWKDGKAVPATDTLPKEDAENMRSILDYLREYDHFENVAPWFGVPPENSNPSWEQLNQVVKDFGIDVNVSIPNDCHAYFNIGETVEVAGYETMQEVSAYTNSLPSPDFSGFSISTGRLGLTLFADGTMQDSFNLSPHLSMLFEKNNCEDGNFEKEEAVFEVSTAGYEARFVAKNLTFQRDSTRSLVDWNGIVLLRRKK